MVSVNYLNGEQRQQYPPIYTQCCGISSSPSMRKHVDGNPLLQCALQLPVPTIKPDWMQLVADTAAAALRRIVASIGNWAKISIRYYNRANREQHVNGRLRHQTTLGIYVYLLLIIISRTVPRIAFVLQTHLMERRVGRLNTWNIWSLDVVKRHLYACVSLCLSLHMMLGLWEVHSCPSVREGVCK